MSNMKTNHTPGPWTLGNKRPMKPHMIRGGGEDIAYTIMNQAGEQEANATLIAAAPELLAAVEAVLDLNDLLPGFRSVVGAAFLGQLRAAKAKARGE